MTQIASTMCLKRFSILNSNPVSSCYLLLQQRSFFGKFFTSMGQYHQNYLSPLKNPVKICSVNLSTCSTLCWKCGESCMVEHKFCPSCSTIQPLRVEDNYFELLGVKLQFEIDADYLSKLFKDLQRLYHPDKFSSASAREQELSAHHSSSINKAYQTLAHPLARAEHLLQLSGLTLLEADTDLDKNFLTTVLELNEELAEAETEDQLADLKRRAQLTYNLLIKEVAAAFKQGNPAASRPLVAQAKYYKSFLDKLRQQERDLGIAD